MSHEEFTSLELNAVRAQQKLINWLALSPSSAALIHDESKDSEDGLHFDVYEEGSHESENPQPPEVTDEMWRQTSKLGCAFQFNMRKDRLHVFVRKPGASEARKLLDKWKQQQKILESVVWNVYLCFFGVLFCFAWFCVSVSRLHEHWHQFESPYETMFHSLLSIFIYFGDAILTQIGIKVN